MRRPEPGSVLFVLPSLGNGGAERVVVQLARAFAAMGRRTGIALFSLKGQDYLGELGESVTLFHLRKGKRGKIRSLWRLIAIARNFAHVVSGLELLTDRITHQCLRVLRFLGSDTRFYAMVHVTLSRYHLFKRPRARRRLLRSYPDFQGVIAVSQGVRDDLERISAGALRATVINDPIDIALVERLARPAISRERPFFLSVGRLEKQKDHATLLRAFRLFSDQTGGSHDLLILGRGSEEGRIEELRAALGLDLAQLLGFVDNPWAYMKSAAALVLTSIFEGFSLVILEALACETPVVATDCPSGPREILANGANGYLVEPGDAEGVCRAMLRVVQDPAGAKVVAARGVEYVRRFDLPLVARRYLDFFAGLPPDEPGEK